jgi:hypothetical protein
MNKERLIKIIEDMTEVIKNLKECKRVLQNNDENLDAFDKVLNISKNYLS